jgi:hypothetical protein
MYRYKIYLMRTSSYLESYKTRTYYLERQKILTMFTAHEPLVPVDFAKVSTVHYKQCEETLEGKAT